jgi:hypothetical protein
VGPPAKSSVSLLIEFIVRARGEITCKQLYGCLEVLAECPQSRHADAAGRLNSATRDNSILVAECRE